MNTRTIIRNRVVATAPWLTLVLLICLGWAMPSRVEHSAEAEARKAQIAAAMESVPRFVGQWVGEDSEVPPAAQKLLRPNAIFSRNYARLTRDGGPPQHVQVIVVHCGDARDMIGHYPPICYPSSGWVALPDNQNRATELVFEKRRFPVQVYRFVRVDEDGRERVIRIFNAFVLPDGSVSRDIADIHRQSERLAVSTQGVAQVQIVTSALIGDEQATEAAVELLAGMTDLFDALGLEQGGGRER